MPHRSTLALAFALVALSGTLGCRDKSKTGAEAKAEAGAASSGLKTVRDLPERHAVELPAGPGSAAPSVMAGTEALHLAWMRDLGEPSLLVASLPTGADEWSEPTVVTSSPRLLVNWADLPALGEREGGGLVVAWPEHHGDDPSAGYGLRIVAAGDDGSFDAGAAWSPDEVRRGPESGFASFVATPAGLRLFWLDGRELGGEGGGTMQLRTVLVDGEGRQDGPSEILDPRTCECCKLGVGALGGRAFAAYRDRSEAEIRDIYVAGPGLAPARVAEDNWTMTGCPVNGPAVATSETRAFVAGFSGAGDRSAAWLASSKDLGAGFGPAERFDLGLPGGRVDLLALPDGGALLSWLEFDGDDPGRGVLLTRRVSDAGELGEAFAVAELGPARDWGFPKAALRGDRVLWVYTDPTGPDRRTRLRAVEGALPPARGQG